MQRKIREALELIGGLIFAWVCLPIFFAFLIIPDFHQWFFAGRNMLIMVGARAEEPLYSGDISRVPRKIPSFSV